MRAGAATSTATTSALVAKENIPPATADGPVFRIKVMVNKAPIGMEADAVVMVMLLSSMEAVAVRPVTEDVMLPGATVLSNQPVGKPNTIEPPAETAVAGLNLMTKLPVVPRAVEAGETVS